MPVGNDRPVEYRMAPHRRALAWLVTDRVGQGIALALMIVWALALYVRGRYAAKD
jgi:hypothetical protein